MFVGQWQVGWLEWTASFVDQPKLQMHTLGSTFCLSQMHGQLPVPRKTQHRIHWRTFGFWQCQFISSWNQSVVFSSGLHDCCCTCTTHFWHFFWWHFMSWPGIGAKGQNTKVSGSPRIWNCGPCQPKGTILNLRTAWHFCMTTRATMLGQLLCASHEVGVIPFFVAVLFLHKSSCLDSVHQTLAHPKFNNTSPNNTCFGGVWAVAHGFCTSLCQFHSVKQPKCHLTASWCDMAQILPMHQHKCATRMNIIFPCLASKYFCTTVELSVLSHAIWLWKNVPKLESRYHSGMFWKPAVIPILKLTNQIPAKTGRNTLICQDLVCHDHHRGPQLLECILPVKGQRLV